MKKILFSIAFLALGFTSFANSEISNKQFSNIEVSEFFKLRTWTGTVIIAGHEVSGTFTSEDGIHMIFEGTIDGDPVRYGGTISGFPDAVGAYCNINPENVKDVIRIIGESHLNDFQEELGTFLKDKL
ncbi:hypothetical protein [Aureivirga sp. CE67]|uniref:hypothetical protein n=1 Tax=Aureivirga sp. CE67 TaxID=1788983 RepID=UPI0018CB90F9|nr:hypothetical protein [Aureivirga sp. CE67]